MQKFNFSIVQLFDENFMAVEIVKTNITEVNLQ